MLNIAGTIFVEEEEEEDGSLDALLILELLNKYNKLK